MNRVLAALNLLGIVLLLGLCVFQWRANSALNLDVNRLEEIRLDQTAKIADQAGRLRGLAADLDRFRDQLGATTLDLKKTRGRLRESERLAAQLANERDQLKEAVVQWTAAVAARDERLKEANDRIRDLGTRLNDAVVKFNALVATHNDLVRQLNEARNPGAAKAAAAGKPAEPPAN